MSAHVDGCLNNPVERGGDDGNGASESDGGSNTNSDSEFEVCVETYSSGKPSEGSVDVVLKLLRNIGREPANVKFRRIRMNNPKIKEASIFFFNHNPLIHHRKDRHTNLQFSISIIRPTITL